MVSPFAGHAPLLVAVTTLVAGSRRRGAWGAARLGLAWGAGHGLTLFAFGLPVVLARAFLPGTVLQFAEAAIGVIIAVLGVQLLRRWRRGAYHAHLHAHEGSQHSHVHGHADAAGHEHAHPPIRTARTAFVVGCVHGIGGSAAIGILLIAGVADRGAAVAALAILAGGTAVSMGLLAAGFGLVLSTRPLRGTLGNAIPVLGTVAILFGAWYALAAWELAPYPL